MKANIECTSLDRSIMQILNVHILLIKITPQDRDRRPRLSARTSLLPNENCPLIRTDEGVCPYFVEIENAYPN